MPQPTLLGTLSHHYAATAPRSPRRAPAEVYSPGEPHSLPRPPWGGWEVSPPSCGMRADGGRHGAARGRGKQCGLRSGAPRQNCAPCLLAVLTDTAGSPVSTSYPWMSQGQVTKGPTVTRCPAWAWLAQALRLKWHRPNSPSRRDVWACFPRKLWKWAQEQPCCPGSRAFSSVRHSHSRTEEEDEYLPSAQQLFCSQACEFLGIHY